MNEKVINDNDDFEVQKDEGFETKPLPANTKHIKGSMSAAKKRKHDAEESLLLNKALSVMTSVPAVSVQEEDDDHVFGRFIASELHSIGNLDLKQLINWKIQSTIYFATSSQSVVSQPTGSYLGPGSASVINSPSHVTPSPHLSSIGNQSSPTGSCLSSNSSFTQCNEVNNNTLKITI